MNQDDMENGSIISCRGRGGRRVECAVAGNSEEQGTGGSGPDGVGEGWGLKGRGEVEWGNLRRGRSGTRRTCRTGLLNCGL